MINLYLSRPGIPADCIPALAAAHRVAVMAAEADGRTLIAALAAEGISAVPLAAHDRLTAYDAVIACGPAARALAGLAAADFHIAVDYVRTEDGDTRMQAIAQATNLPIFALGEDGALLTGAGEPRYLGTINAYYPIMPLDIL